MKISIRYFYCSVLCIAMIGLFIQQQALTRSSGPLASFTGAPGETSCTTCHSATENAGHGVITLVSDSGENVYVKNRKYHLTLTVMDTGIVKFGFQIVSLFDKGHGNAGTFTITDLDKTKTETGMGRTYVSHTLNGTVAESPGLISWAFDWKSPDSLNGPITFYYCVNSSNNSGTSAGDNIYRLKTTLQPASVASVFKSFKNKPLTFFCSGLNQLSVSAATPDPLSISLWLWDINGSRIGNGLLKTISAGLTEENIFIPSGSGKIIFIKYIQDGNEYCEKILMEGL